MNWAYFYLICFLVGFLLTAISFVLGGVDLHLHVPHGEFHLPHFHLGHGDVHVHAPHVDLHGDGAMKGAVHGAQIGYINFGTVAAFLAWFGGTGYLLTRYWAPVVPAVLGLATLSGLMGATIVFWFVAKVLMKYEKDLDPGDYRMMGTLGRVVSPIRAGGTGEIVYVHEGVRQTAGARSEDGGAIEKGAEVVVTQYDKGIAYVKRWSDL